MIIRTTPLGARASALSKRGALHTSALGSNFDGQERDSKRTKASLHFPYGDYAPEKLQEAADRVLDQYLKPDDDSKSDPKPSVQLFTVADGIDTEVLLANLSETLASANAMLNDLAFDQDGSRRHVALGVAQMIELGMLLANKCLDRVELRT